MNNDSTTDPTEYVSIVGVDQIGPDATEADLEAFCSAATDWLTEHEGDDLSITVRPPRNRNEVTGRYHVRHGVPAGREIGRLGDPDEKDERVIALLDEVWELYCRNELPGAVAEETA